MRRLALLALIFCVLGLTACGGPSQDAANQLPPVIDRALIFGDPETSGGELSPDGRMVSFIKPYQDVRNIWVKAVDAPMDSARPVTADSRPVLGYFWSQNSRYVLYVQDRDGDENFHVWAVDPAAAAEEGSGVPPARDLTPIDGVRARIYALPKDDPDTIIVGLNDREPSLHDVYKVSISTGDRELMIRNTQGVGAYEFDLDGEARLAWRQKPDGGGEILRVDGDTLTKVYECTFEEVCQPIQFHPDGERCYIRSNVGDDVDLQRLLLLDPQTGGTEVVHADPEQQVDLGGALFAEDTDELIATWYLGDRLRIYPLREDLAADLEFLEAELPDGELTPVSATRDMNLWLVAVARDVDPGSVYVYDRAARTVDLLYRTRPDLPTENLASMQPVRYTARDGREIPAYLTLPPGVEAKGLPTVIHPHGGPWARDTWGYDAYAQFLANRGYAVLQPNFRGSAGYGKDFLNAGNKEWGTGAMQHDITDGVRWLVSEGISDPERIGIFGGSYGGYATLAGVAFTPDLYACGVPYVAPSNLITLIESFPAYWRPFLKGSWFLRVGDPEVEADREDLIARSPLTAVEQIDVPLLVVHGANDPRVKQSESDRIVAALRDKGQDVEYVVAPDEGHGFRAPDNRMALAVAMERFLAKHLGGRLQEEVPDELAAHLQSITVDPATVQVEAAPSS